MPLDRPYDDSLARRNIVRAKVLRSASEALVKDIRSSARQVVQRDRENHWADVWRRLLEERREP